MSKEEQAKQKEQQRQENNSKNRSSANHYKRLAEEYQAQADKKKKELERLNKAKRALNKEMTNFTTFENKVKNYSHTLSAGTFKGTLRDKFNNKSDAMGSSLQKEKNSYQKNMSILSKEIAKKELEQGDLSKSISNAWDAVSNFLAAII